MSGQYASHYENVFISDDFELRMATAGVFTYPQTYHWVWNRVRKHVSDHVPIYLVLGAPEPMLSKGGDSQLGNRTASATAACIDLNRASAEELGRLMHVGPTRAETIIRGRPWHSVDELVRVRGLGEARVSDIAASGQVCPL